MLHCGGHKSYSVFQKMYIVQEKHLGLVQLFLSHVDWVGLRKKYERF
jgi:hypothetical protein